MDKKRQIRLEKLTDEATRNFPELSQELAEKAALLESAPGGAASDHVMRITRIVAEGASRAVSSERIILAANGARPVARIKNNRVTEDFVGPSSTSWAAAIRASQDKLNAAIPAVGRIELINSEIPWAGTGWLIAEGILVTNRHVASLFAKKNAGGDFVFKAGFNDGRISSDIDFLEVEDRTDSNEHPVTGIIWIVDEADVAFLSVSRAPGKPALPKPIRLAKEPAAEHTKIAAIGYPARDPSIPDQQLVERIFGDVYEKKRLAPGFVTLNTEDQLNHDCSTLGGNSGSVLIDMASGEAVGLHCGGYLDDSANIAVPAARLNEYLEEAQRRLAKRVDEERERLPPSASSGAEVTSISAGVLTHRLNIPIEIVVKIGNSVCVDQLGSPAGPGASAAGSEATVDDAVKLARAKFGSLPGVVAIRAGYRFKNGWIEDEPVVVIEVGEKLSMKDLKVQGRQAFPRELLGIGIDLRTAPLPDELDRLGIDLVARERPARPAGYTEPPGYDNPRSPMALTRVRGERMTAIFHVSPDAGFPTLRDFLGRVDKHLTATMYEWEPNHISDAIEEAMRPPNRTLRMVTQKRGVGEGDATESAVADMQERIGAKFSHVWASVRGPQRRIQSSYHIKVASRDEREFWLSSGNWKDSNQPAIDPIKDGLTDDSALRDYNREWHAIIEHRGLATLFQHYIEYDFEQARLFPLAEEEAVALPSVEFFVPLEVRSERPAQVQYFEPLHINNEELDIEPLLTPDRDAQGRRIFITAATEMIKRATAKVYVQNQSFAMSGDDNDEIVEFFTVLRDKQRQRGMDVRVIFRDARDFPRRADLIRQQELIERLHEFGLDTSPGGLRLQSKCHTKGIIVDSKEVMLGSQNITNQGALVNRDASLLVRSEKVAKYFEKVFLFDWNNRAHNRADESVAGIRLAQPGEATPAGFRRVSLAEVLADE